MCLKNSFSEFKVFAFKVLCIFLLQPHLLFLMPLQHTPSQRMHKSHDHQIDEHCIQHIPRCLCKDLIRRHICVDIIIASFFHQTIVWYRLIVCTHKLLFHGTFIDALEFLYILCLRTDQSLVIRCNDLIIFAYNNRSIVFQTVAGKKRIDRMVKNTRISLRRMIIYQNDTRLILSAVRCYINIGTIFAFHSHRICFFMKIHYIQQNILISLAQDFLCLYFIRAVFFLNLSILIQNQDSCEVTYRTIIFQQFFCYI